MKTIKLNLKSKRNDKELRMFLSWDIPIEELPKIIAYMERFKRNKTCKKQKL